MIALLTALALPFAQAAAAQAAGKAPPTAPPSPAAIAAAAPASEWRAIAAQDLLVMDLAPDPAGAPRRIVIQLIPAPLSTAHVANVRALAAAHWWDGTSVNRVQDNYVAQWGDATEKKPLPAGLAAVPESAYDTDWSALPASDRHAPIAARTVRIDGKPVSRPADVYAPGLLYYRGWPLATDLASVAQGRKVWPVHCYGMVGVGRDLSPSTGTGAELYAVIGHAPRHLDRNIALVGRVVAGIEYLSALPRGTGALGFYERPDQRVAIRSIRLASEMPAADQPRFEYLSTDGAAFAAYADARLNRELPFFIRPAGAADVCNIPVPIRAVK